jgi:hypothetical protein
VDFLDLWYSIIHSAKRTSEREVHDVRKHNKLVDLVVAFKEHIVKDDKKYSYLYSEMTDFSMAFREAYNDAPAAQNGFLDQEVAAWARMNFFYARLTDGDVSDLSMYSIFAMRAALEDKLQDDPEATAVQKYDAFVPAAGSWILGAGHKIFRIQKDLTPSDDKGGDPARGGELWNGKSELSKERWMFWKERLAAISKMDELQEGTRVVAKDAVEEMERSQTYELMR